MYRMIFSNPLDQGCRYVLWDRQTQSIDTEEKNICWSHEGLAEQKKGNLHSVNPFALLPFRQEENNLHILAKARSRGSYYNTLTWLSLGSELP